MEWTGGAPRSTPASGVTRSKEPAMPRHSKDTVAVLGIDIGKNTFHLVGLNKRGAIVLRLKLSRTQLEAKLANLPPCLVGMEACVGAHHLSRTGCGPHCRASSPPAPTCCRRACCTSSRTWSVTGVASISASTLSRSKSSG